MASVTSWTRLEPLPRTFDLQPALEARVADPLWLLARQWQTLEFGGEDAGSPIVAKITADSVRLHRIAMGGGAAVAYDDLAAPLEAAVECEPFDMADSERLRVDAGLHFLRLLVKHRAPGQRARYTKHYRFTPGDDPVPARGASFRDLATGRAPDGARLLADLTAHRGRRRKLVSLPARPAVPAAARGKVLAAANEWLAWWNGLITTPARDPAWDPRRMEYSFAVAAGTSDGQTVLAADEYAEGHLDWHAFTGRPGVTLDDAPPVTPRRTVRTVIPTPASYSGMPVDRFWQFEDGRVSFGSLDAGPSDLTRLVLVEFALVYGNDWFVVPVDLEVGSLCTIIALEIVDTFGVSTAVPPMPTGGGWAMFNLTGFNLAGSAPTRPTGQAPAFFLPPTLARTVDGDPIESVTLLRDEMANMVWGVEHLVSGTTGDVVDRDQRAPTPGMGLQQLDGEVADAELIYRLATPVPDHWIPFVPVPAGGDDPGVVLERRTMRRVTSDGTVDIEPLGRLLEPGTVLRIQEAEVPREGIIVERSFQLARWSDGSTHLWLGRRKRVGRGEGSSGLRFDVVDRAGTPED
jgi:hypothetical protein